MPQGWTEVATHVGEGVELAWRPGEPGGGALARADGAEGGAAGWKCWRLGAVMEAEPETVTSVLMDYEASCQWNPALARTKVTAELQRMYCVVQKLRRKRHVTDTFVGLPLMSHVRP